MISVFHDLWCSSVARMVALSLLGAGLLPTDLPAESATKPAGTEVVVSGLDFPCGLAIRPDWFEIYVAESGAGRVVRIDASQAREALTGFRLANVPWLGTRPLGPLGLCFLSRDQLAVGQAGNVAGQEVVSVFELPPPTPTNDPLAEQPEEPKETLEPQAVSAAVGHLGPIGKPALRGPAQDAGWGDIWSLASDDGSLYAAAQDAVPWGAPAPQGGIAFARFRSDEPSPITTFLSVDTHLARPIRAIAISPDGHLLAATASGNAHDASDLTFYHARSGKVLLRLKLPLAHVVALAFHPVNGTLYALDSPWQGESSGSLCRLDSQLTKGQQSLVVQQRLALPRPTALAFRATGELYVTVLGLPDQPQGGALLRVSDLPE